MKKPFTISLFLILIDQMVKIFITRHYIGTEVILLPDILLFRPIQNTNLSWLASVFDYKMSVLSMLVLQVFSLLSILVIYHYLSYLWTERKGLLKFMLSCHIAGISCSFIDVMFWGGSWDFIRLFDWFTFDLKDVYLNAGTISVFLYCILYHFKIYNKMSKIERKEAGIFLWIKREVSNMR